MVGNPTACLQEEQTAEGIWGKPKHIIQGAESGYIAMAVTRVCGAVQAQPGTGVAAVYITVY